MCIVADMYRKHDTLLRRIRVIFCCAHALPQGYCRLSATFVIAVYATCTISTQRQVSGLQARRTSGAGGHNR